MVINFGAGRMVVVKGVLLNVVSTVMTVWGYETVRLYPFD